MTNVNAIDGIKYGFRLIGYMIAVFIIGVIPAFIGVGVASEGSIGAIILGGLIGLIGYLVLFAGFAGVQYKIIADGVEKGMNAAQTGDTGAGGPSGRGGGGQQGR